MPDSFGSHLRALRRAAGLTQTRLTNDVNAALSDGDPRGFDVTYLSKIERGRVNPPSARVVVALARVLHVDSDDLVARSGHVPDGLAILLRESPGARAFLLTAMRSRLTDGDWVALRTEALRLHHEPG